MSKINKFEFEDLFREGKFDPALFNHEAHLRLAWIHLKKYGRDQAVLNVTTQLKSYVKLLGVEEKYNETLTKAAVLAVYHFMLKEDIDDFDEFIRSYPRLKTHFRELIGQHYITNIFQSDRAKKEWLEPELTAFDA